MLSIVNSQACQAAQSTLLLVDMRSGENQLVYGSKTDRNQAVGLHSNISTFPVWVWGCVAVTHQESTIILV